MIAFILLISFQAFSSGLSELSIDYQKFIPGGRFLELPNQPVNESFALNFNIDLAGPFYWENKIHALTLPNKFAWIGWDFEIGTRLFSDGLRIFYHHHSQHTLDTLDPSFPVQDAIGLKWILMRKQHED